MIVRLALAACLALAGGGGGAAPAACALRDVLAARLETKYGEAVLGRGLTAEGAMVEIWASPGTGTWSIVVTSPAGLACLLGAGTDWSVIAPPKPDRKL